MNARPSAGPDGDRLFLQGRCAVSGAALFGCRTDDCIQVM
jgi:hypothetical protein